MAASSSGRIAAWQEAVHILLDLAGDAVGYTCTMTACSRAGFWSKSLMLLERMDQQRVERDDVAMNAACGACERATLWQAAVRLMHWQKRAVSSTIHACIKGTRGDLKRCIYQIRCHGQVRFFIWFSVLNDLESNGNVEC